MQIEALATEHASTRPWLVLEPAQVTACGVEAARFYAGYGDIASVSLSLVLPSAPGAGGTLPAPIDDVDWPEVPAALPIRSLALIAPETELTTGEWAVIRPLFFLYCERENAMALEASRGLGLDVFGRSASEIAQEILQMETEIIPSKAFVHPGFTV